MSNLLDKMKEMCSCSLCSECPIPSLCDDIQEALLKAERHCDNCKHLVMWNGNDKYSECDKTTMMFYPFEVDTRETVCNYWSKKDEEVN